MADEDPQIGLAGEALLDPTAVLPPNLALVQVGLGRFDGDNRLLRGSELTPTRRSEPWSQVAR
jgi:hypothetical protein